MSDATRKAFDERVERALGDPAMQRVLADGQDYVQELIGPARAEPDWPAALDEISRVRLATLAHLDRYVDEFATTSSAPAGAPSSPPTPRRPAVTSPVRRASAASSSW